MKGMEALALRDTVVSRTFLPVLVPAHIVSDYIREFSNNTVHEPFQRYFESV